MNDAFGVRGLQPVQNLNSKIKEFRSWQRMFLDMALKSLAVQQLHRNERLALILINVVYGADIRMVQRRRSVGLSLKAFEGLLVTREVQRQKLECDQASQLSVFRFVHNAHAP